MVVMLESIGILQNAYFEYLQRRKFFLRSKSITLTTTLYYYRKNAHYYMMLSDLKEIKKTNGTSVYIISKCPHCGKEMTTFENNDVIEASCRDCNIWKRY